jgi:Na+(H+)/acetate symporter ActP
MDWQHYIPLAFVLVITLITVGMGIWATRSSRTTSDFFVAGRSVNVFWNASAISGEYLSAASFMGIAGMLMKNGYDALWYPVGYATGYLFLLLFIAGPLRRFGAYTIPDFAEGRFDSPLFRKIAVTFVLFIGLFYTMPQMKGAGVTMTGIMGWPYALGILVVGAVITFNVALGGMKGITIVQAFQYWAKVFAISLPVFLLMAYHGGYSGHLERMTGEPSTVPIADHDITLKFKGSASRPANAISFSTAGASKVWFPKGAVIEKVGTTRKAEPGEDKSELHLMYAPIEDPNGFFAGSTFPAHKDKDGNSTLPEKAMVIFGPFPVTKGGSPVLKDGKPVKDSVKLEFKEAAEALLAKGSYIPNAPKNEKWVQPFGSLTSKYGFPLLYTYSLILALVCGTAGLPHILVRFYTNPDGRSAKRTTMLVMILLGCFYVFPAVWGTLGRAVMPWLYADNTHDSVVIKLPRILSSGLLGQTLTGITSAGAFAAFMSTFSGLLVSMSGAMAHDIYGKILKPDATPKQRLTAFKVAAVVFGSLAMALGLAVEAFDINMMVGWAFAIAAASYFPLLLVGSWWRGLTKYGAAAGMLAGGLLSLLAIVFSMLLDKKIVTIELSGVVRTLLEQPAIWGVPLALLVMYAVSKVTAQHVPPDVTLKMLRLHAPEEMGLSKNYIEH